VYWSGRFYYSAEAEEIDPPGTDWVPGLLRPELPVTPPRALPPLGLRQGAP
jgi:hypothetical protein